MESNSNKPSEPGMATKAPDPPQPPVPPAKPPSNPARVPESGSESDGHEQEFSIKETGSLKLKITSKRINKKPSPARETKPEPIQPTKPSSGIKITIHKRVRRPDSAKKGIDSKKQDADAAKKVNSANLMFRCL